MSHTGKGRVVYWYGMSLHELSACFAKHQIHLYAHLMFCLKDGHLASMYEYKYVKRDIQG